jgi:hypothetical protein
MERHIVNTAVPTGFEYFLDQTSPAPQIPTALPIPANENIKLKADWMTPAEALQTIARIKKRLKLENLQTEELLYSNVRRKIWQEVLACEACLRWTYFR